MRCVGDRKRCKWSQSAPAVANENSQGWGQASVSESAKPVAKWCFEIHSLDFDVFPILRQRRVNVAVVLLGCQTALVVIGRCTVCAGSKLWTPKSKLRFFAIFVLVSPTLHAHMVFMADKRWSWLSAAAECYRFFWQLKMVECEWPSEASTNVGWKRDILWVLGGYPSLICSVGLLDDHLSSECVAQHLPTS
jgi:hypothetical protein